jgi:threonine-phosphate decarboxylase
LIDSAREHNLAVLLDEAFMDYCPDHSLHREPLKTENLIVFLSVTKFFAMPGLRVAYAISNSARIGSMNRFIAPWPVTSLACDAVSAALGDKSFAIESRQANEQQRSWLQQELSRLMIATYPSEANFLLLRMPDAVDVAQVRERMIVEERIVLRSCANFEGLPSGHIRIAVRSKIENQQLIHALERVLASALGQRRATSVD